jgi:hypothetical protein
LYIQNKANWASRFPVHTSAKTSRHVGTNVFAFGRPSPCDTDKREKRLSAAAQLLLNYYSILSRGTSSGFGIAPSLRRSSQASHHHPHACVYPSDFCASISAAAFGGCCSYRILHQRSCSRDSGTNRRFHMEWVSHSYGPMRISQSVSRSVSQLVDEANWYGHNNSLS